MLTIYDTTYAMMMYVKSQIAPYTQVDVKEHDNCLYNIRFYDFGGIEVNENLMRIKVGMKSFPIYNTEFSRLEVE